LHRLADCLGDEGGVMVAIFAFVACVHFDAPGYWFLIGFLCLLLD
jgi:hypothetical protein